MLQEMVLTSGIITYYMALCEPNPDKQEGDETTIGHLCFIHSAKSATFWGMETSKFIAYYRVSMIYRPKASPAIVPSPVLLTHVEFRPPTGGNGMVRL